MLKGLLSWLKNQAQPALKRNFMDPEFIRGYQETSAMLILRYSHFPGAPFAVSITNHRLQHSKGVKAAVEDFSTLIRAVENGEVNFRGPVHARR